MTKRIFHSICLVALAVFLASVVLILGMLYSYFSQVQHDQLRMQTVLAAQGVEEMGLAYFEDLDLRRGRITWINAEGQVLYDSQADTASMENHLQREEIREALDTGWGESSRWSVTLMERALYAAKRLPDGSVLRLSSSQSTVLTLLLGMSQPILIVLILAIILSVVLAMRLSRRIVRPLNELDLDAPADSECYEELAPLLHRIDSQQRQLKFQEYQLRQKQDELDAVTGSMREGLVLLNGSGKILSINPAARELLDTGLSCVGDDILTVNRNLDLQTVLSKAMGGIAAEKTIPLHGGRYQADASPVFSGGTVSGVALLLFDVTEKEQAEQMRREFTANVSHELRTPLTTISGCAELLKNGIVKPEDVQSFGENIYREAQRMVRLVDDIISLSHLDEGAEDLKREHVDLYQIAQEAVQPLKAKAQLAGISDGIGIPPEHQSHIFERFYRVDKSRSKAVGGTGLGLSIVKHAVMVHGGKVELHSVLDEGTTVSVCFPRQK